MGEPRHEDRIHRAQVWWSCAVVILLGVAAVFHWSAPKNALMEQDRAPASKLESAARP